MIISSSRNLIMLMKLVRLIDALFWETRIITTTVTTTTVWVISEPIDSPANENTIQESSRIMTNTLSPATSSVYLDDRKAIPSGDFTDGVNIYIQGYDPIEIPPLVQTRPLLAENGRVNHRYHPAYPGAPIVTCVNSGERKFAYVDGDRLSRTNTVSYVTRKSAFVTMAKTQDEILFKDIKSCDTMYDDLAIRVWLTKDYFFLSIHNQAGEHIRVRQDNIKQFTSVPACVNMSYAITRSLLLDMDLAQVSISNYDEDKLAVAILGLLLAAKK